MTTELPGPHGYLTCEDMQHVYEKQRRALDKIVERGCHHCSARELACSATGQTYNLPEHVPDSTERVVQRQREDILKLRDAIFTGDIDKNLAALADTERYEKYRPSREAQSHDE